MRVRLDFGRIVPGVVLVLLALAMLAVLVLIAAISFLFSFVPFWAGVLQFTLQLTLVPAVLIVVGVVIALTGASWWGKGGEGWLSGIAKARAGEDRLRISARVGEVIGVFISLIIIAFLYENQVRGVEFFAPNFGGTEQLFFYGPLVSGIVLSLARAVYGRRNGIRPFDSLNMAFLAIAAFALLAEFPFDFTHLGDMFPSQLQILFGWVSNDVGRILFFIAGLVAAASFVYTFTLYAAVRQQMHRAVASGTGGDPFTP